MSPRVLLVDPATRDRLRVMAMLQGVADVHSPELGQDPVRLVRHTRYDAVLMALPRLAARRGLHLCRTLRTDAGTPPPVGLLDPWRRLPDAAVSGALEDSLADGYLGGATSPEALHTFLTQLIHREQPCVKGTAPARSLWGRIRGGF